MNFLALRKKMQERGFDLFDDGIVFSLWDNRGASFLFSTKEWSEMLEYCNDLLSE